MLRLARAAVLVALVLLLPTSFGLIAPPPEPVALPETQGPVGEPLGDISDAELVYRLARIGGHPVEWPALPAAPLAADLPALVLRLGERAGVPVEPADAAVFATLDPAVALPVAHLLVAVDAAWDMRDEAFAGLTPDEQEELLRLSFADQVTDARYAELSAQMNATKLLEAAILLLDTLEGVVLPQLVALKDAPVWPAQAVADPGGVLRIGGTGNDLETRHRIVQIDPRGDDRYENNAGATTIGNNFVGDPDPLQTAVGVSIDLQGADVYEQRRDVPAQGGAWLGVGVLAEFTGADTYLCEFFCQAADAHGVGLLRDHDGDDYYDGGGERLGSATLVAALRDDAGADFYRAATSSGGYGYLARATGLLWDRAGVDSYTTHGFAHLVYGWGKSGGRGWLADEGQDVDYYETEHYWYEPDRHGCNNCTWTIGTGIALRPAHGHGVDNRGGLAMLLAEYEHV